jgi:hypothetical protein
MANSDCLEENVSNHDYTAHLDIEYGAFEDDIKYAKQYHKKLNRHKELKKAVPMHPVLNQYKHRICEDYELTHTSKWRGNILQEYKRESFEKDREKCCEDFETSFEKVREKPS